jgi:hypothetical protein
MQALAQNRRAFAALVALLVAAAFGAAIASGGDNIGPTHQDQARSSWTAPPA